MEHISRTRNTVLRENQVKSIVRGIRLRAMVAATDVFGKDAVSESIDVAIQLTDDSEKRHKVGMKYLNELIEGNVAEENRDYVNDTINLVLADVKPVPTPSDKIIAEKAISDADSCVPFLRKRAKIDISQLNDAMVEELWDRLSEVGERVDGARELELRTDIVDGKATYVEVLVDPKVLILAKEKESNLQRAY